ncbi:MAG: hypothetical protein RLZZ536_2296 [Planctomycetota bacterium]
MLRRERFGRDSPELSGDIVVCRQSVKNPQAAGCLRTQVLVSSSSAVKRDLLLELGRVRVFSRWWRRARPRP